MARLEGIPGKDWPPEMLDALVALRPPPEHEPPDRGGKRVKGHPALEAFAIHPDLARAFFTFNRHVLWGTTLPHRLRHIVILRVAARRRAAFVWGEHASQAREAGLTDDEIAAVASPAGTPLDADLEVALLQAVDEMIDVGVIAPATWAVLADHLTPAQLVDLVFTAGCYNTVAWFTRSIELDVDPDNPDQLPLGDGA
jgi:alkylhydroperoxidase family enzyme